MTPDLPKLISKLKSAPRRVWRSIWFMDDDDNTPQGKMARGTFYLFYAFLAFMIVFGGIVPAIDYACGGCWQEARNKR